MQMNRNKKKLESWTFAVGETQDCLADAKMVTVPHTWNVEEGLYEYAGSGWYAYQLTMPMPVEGDRYWLEFGAVYHDAWVYINGKLAGAHLHSGAVLQFAIDRGCHAKAPYYLGNLYYDKLQWQEAVRLWELSAQTDSMFPTVHRNLALAYYNKCKEPDKAKQSLETAFSLNPSDVRIFLERDQLHKKLGWSFEKRLADYEAHTALLEGRDDLYIEYITLINLTGNHEKAYDCIMSHKFHPWEGGEGKITTQYTLALLAMAQDALRQKDYTKAEELLRKAFVYPENLGEGKLEGTKDNHLYYHLGLALEGQGRTAEAEACFCNATLGTDEPAGAMYYNDQPADMILYQGLSYLKLGKDREAKARFYRLIDYGERHLNDEVKIQYFAVSLPEFLIFDEDYTMRNRAHCYYLMALGNMGLGDAGKASAFLEQTMAVEPSHMMCRVYQAQTL